MKTQKKFRGQAAVETAIVLPLFVFAMLGMVQLGLMNQARLLTKYAAYKAVRAGALYRGEIENMENAALAVLTPMVSRDDSVGGVKKTKDSGEYVAAFNSYQSGMRNKQAGNIHIAEVRICAPYGRGNVTGDFDNPETSKLSDWRNFEDTKLSIEVTFYYRLFIPFANGMLWYSARGVEGAAAIKNTMKYLKIHQGDQKIGGFKDPGNNASEDNVRAAAGQKKYIIPIRASYSMRMQSNWKSSPPSSNECHINWPKSGGSGGDSSDQDEPAVEDSFF
jgi:hypothetical protein